MIKSEERSFRIPENMPARIGGTGIWSEIFKIVSIAVAYFFVAKFSLSFLFEPENIAAIWPLTGIFLSAVLLVRKTTRPYLIATLFLTDFLCEISAGTPPVVSLVYSAALAGDATLGAWLMIRFVGEPITFNKIKDIVGFLLLTVILSNALLSVVAASAATIYLGSPFWSSWFRWFFPDGVGSVLVTPFIISSACVFKKKFEGFKSSQFIEGVVLLLSIALTGYLVSSHFLNGNGSIFLLTVFSFPFLIWASLRLGVLGTGMAAIMLAATVVQKAQSGYFPQIGAGSNLDTIIAVQICIAMMSIPTLLLAALITERKRAEEALRVMTEQLQLALGAARMGVWQHNLQSDIITTIQGNGPISGLPEWAHPKNLETLLALVHPEDRETLRQQIWQATEKEADFEAEFRLSLPDGIIRWVTARGRFSHDARRSLLLTGVDLDITERKLAEEELLESEKRYRELFDNISSGVAIYEVRDDGEDFVFKDFNKAGERADGEPREDLIGKSIYEVRPGIEGFGLLDVFRRVWKTGVPERYPAKMYRDCRLAKWYENFVYRLPTGEIVAVFDDITERKRAEEVLRESEERFRELANLLPQTIYELDAAGHFAYSNEYGFASTGYTQADIKAGLNALELVIPQDRERCAANMQQVLAGGRRGADEYTMHRKDGSEFSVIIYSAPIFRHGQIVGIRGIVADITERKQAEEALRENEQRLRSVLDATPFPIALVDVQDNNINYWSRSALTLFGHTAPTATEWYQIAYPDPDYQREVIERWKPSVEKARLSGQAVNAGEYRVACSNGATRICELYVAFIADKLIVTFNDITKRKLAEEKLRLLTTRYAAILASIPDIIMEVDFNKVYTWANKAGLEFFGDDVIGKEAARYFEGEQQTYNVVQPLFAGNEDIIYVESWQRRRDGEKRLLAWWCKACKDDDDRVIGALSAAQDITEQKRADEALRLSEHRYHQLFNSVMEGIGIVDANEVIEYCNPAFVDLFEAKSQEELIGRCLLDFVPEDQRPAVLTQTETRKKGISSQYELEIVTLKFHNRTILSSISPRFDDQNNYCGAFGAIMDITESKRLQKQSFRAERLETAGKIAGQVAHDFNNLLSPIIAYPEFIRDELPQDHPARKYLNDIEAAATKIADINQQLLTLSRRGHYDQETLDLNALILASLADLGQLPSTIICETDLFDGLMHIKGGAAQLHRVFFNLLVNARDALQDIGTISIKTENCYADETRVRFDRIPRGEYVKVTISDSGCGIPDEIVQKIFDPFFTTKLTNQKRGSGLGLSVVDAVVKDHGGYIDLSTEVGVGTSFYLYFPTTHDSPDGTPDEKIVGGNETILIIDDDQMQLDVSQNLLTKLGYKVTTRESGEKAIRLLKDKPQDLLILDMVMPNGIDGVETYRRSLSINPNQKAIIVSGFAETERVREALDMGVGAFVKKPLNRKTIALAVRSELDRAMKTASPHSR